MSDGERTEGARPSGGRTAGGSLLPREHGAYAQLTFPLLTGLGYARFHPGALAFGIAAVALFLAHEPVALMAGVRGPRLRDALGGAARRRLVLLAAAALLGAGAAVGLAPARAWVGAAVPAGLALLLVPVFGRRGIKSLAAETLVAVTFASALVPLALCGEVGVEPVVLATAVWAAAFLPSILAVHAVKVKHKGRADGRWTVRATPTAAIAVAVAAVVAAAALPPWGRDALAVIPPALAVLVVGVATPHPRHLKRIGWSMVAADTAALVLLLLL